MGGPYKFLSAWLSVPSRVPQGGILGPSCSSYLSTLVLTNLTRILKMPFNTNKCQFILFDRSDPRHSMGQYTPAGVVFKEDFCRERCLGALIIGLTVLSLVQRCSQKRANVILGRMACSVMYRGSVNSCGSVLRISIPNFH